MAEADYARAPVLLFDPVHANQRTTRYALFEIGFRQIECVSTLEDLKAGITDVNPLMIVAESSATDADVFRIVRSIRRSELGNNPFVVILLTTWGRDTGHIRKAIECGADDLIVRPFSTMFAEERVRTLIKGRKQFIVTSDYIGPDRRKNNDRSSSAQALEVPNLLQAVVEGDTEALSRGSQWIQEAKSTVSAERIRRGAMRIVVGVELYLGGTKDGSSAKLDIDDMAKTSRELRAQLIKASRAEAAEVAQALIDQIGSLKPDEAPAASLKLIKELAMGAYAAFANGDGLEKSRDEIDRTVASLRKRLQARAAAVQAQQAPQAADGAGQSEQAALKRAGM
ncbi:MAG: response regulator receiver protein [Maricaulis sp.]|jgi:DNA-binding response OmpR family regulator/HPt (histidine-containing phosphotransfer) domain-containing protein|uniref:response regulator receiver protein n=1 Tax=Maricaulis sp. TaxID=1486257 RepID=UPI001B2E8303|nr:response regulator receiver protein [Maricaulis sp.]MBO6728169.1 response regulator receiver protein [Maricaulis sp.]MBO6846555.1 response regulator receiver protein [Maricaulis sp.]MBO6877208.1 response regulator receiver protein [Maricaulis sp.]